jgi:hypothetical protein
MATQWNQNGYNLAVRLGHMAIQSVQRMVRAHTRDLQKLPGGKRKLAEAQKHIDTLKQIIKDDSCHG